MAGKALRYSCSGCHGQLRAANKSLSLGEKYCTTVSLSKRATRAAWRPPSAFATSASQSSTDRGPEEELASKAWIAAGADRTGPCWPTSTPGLAPGKSRFMTQAFGLTKTYQRRILVLPEL